MSLARPTMLSPCVPVSTRTHEIVLTADDRDLGALLSPLFAQAAADWYVHSGGFGLTALPNATDWPEHEDYIRYQLDTAPSYEDWMDWFPNLPAAIESTDFYGIFDYGDWPIDYEGYGVAPLNPKYDNDYGMWLQWARGGRPTLVRPGPGRRTPRRGRGHPAQSA